MTLDLTHINFVFVTQRIVASCKGVSQTCGWQTVTGFIVRETFHRAYTMLQHLCSRFMSVDCGYPFQ